MVSLASELGSPASIFYRVLWLIGTGQETTAPFPSYMSTRPASFNGPRVGKYALCRTRACEEGWQIHLAAQNGAVWAIWPVPWETELKSEERQCLGGEVLSVGGAGVGVSKVVVVSLFLRKLPQGAPSPIQCSMDGSLWGLSGTEML